MSKYSHLVPFWLAIVIGVGTLHGKPISFWEGVALVLSASLFGVAGYIEHQNKEDTL